MRASAKTSAVVISALVLVLGLVIDPRSTLAAYLAAWVGLGAIPIGALGVLMISYLVRRAWTEKLHRVLVAGTSALPLVGILYVPLLIGMTQLYPAASGHHPLPPFKATWLAPWFFALRTIFYFIVLWLLARWQRAAWGDSERTVRSASAGLIIFALLVSIAGVDWIESLQPDFHSSEYGLLYLGFVFLNGVAFGIAAGLSLERWIGPTKGYSALLLSTILLWTYLHAMQYIVIWSGNIPDEAIWYLERSSNGWQVEMALLALGQFVVPFFALLSARVRHDRRWLLALCVLTLVMRCWESAILILPGVRDISPLIVVPMLLAALIFVAIILWWTFEIALRRGDLLRRSEAPTAAARAEAR